MIRSRRGNVYDLEAAMDNGFDNIWFLVILFAAWVVFMRWVMPKIKRPRGGG